VIDDNEGYADESRVHIAMLDNVLLVRRLRKVLRGVRELSDVLRILETTCPFCWDNNIDCTCNADDFVKYRKIAKHVKESYDIEQSKLELR